jgi:exodeoxyribonuclease VII small subunit
MGEEPAEGGGGEPTFEVSLAALERVVARLESGEVGLEEALKLFEEGRGHLTRCRDRLGAVQQRIEELTGPGSPEAGQEARPPF